MLGWLLLGALIAGAIIITVGFLSEDTAKNALDLKGFIKAKVKERSGNVVKMDAIDSYGNEKEVEFQATGGVSSGIYVGQTIYV